MSEDITRRFSNQPNGRSDLEERLDKLEGQDLSQ
jgi:hypothetical protein